jgi:hypothetical protein
MFRSFSLFLTSISLVKARRNIKCDITPQIPVPVVVSRVCSPHPGKELMRRGRNSRPDGQSCDCYRESRATGIEQSKIWPRPDLTSRAPADSSNQIHRGCGWPFIEQDRSPETRLVLFSFASLSPLRGTSCLPNYILKPHRSLLLR